MVADVVDISHARSTCLLLLPSCRVLSALLWVRSVLSSDFWMYVWGVVHAQSSSARKMVVEIVTVEYDQLQTWATTPPGTAAVFRVFQLILTTVKVCVDLKDRKFQRRCLLRSLTCLLLIQSRSVLCTLMCVRSVLSSDFRMYVQGVVVRRTVFHDSAVNAAATHLRSVSRHTEPHEPNVCSGSYFKL